MSSRVPMARRAAGAAAPSGTQTNPLKIRLRAISSALVLVAFIAATSACKPDDTTGPGDQGGTAGTSPTATSEPAKGTYRVTVNGFRVVTETWDHALEVDGKGDEVYLSVGMKVVDKAGVSRLPVTGGDPAAISAVMGDTNGQNGRVTAGSRSSAGGLRTGDTFPTSHPWTLSGSPTADRAPFSAGTVTLVEGRDTMMVSPAIWEWDGGSDVFRDWVGWFERAAGKIPSPTAGSVGGVVFEATKIGLGALTSLSDAGVVGQASDRPIGIKAQGPTGFEFDPRVIALDYAAAEWLVHNDPTGKGSGVLELAFQDAPRYHGHYVVYLQVTRMS